MLTAASAVSSLSSVCLALMLLAVLEYLSVLTQSLRETTEKILVTAKETESASNALLAFAAYLMAGSSYFLPISYGFFMDTDG